MPKLIRVLLISFFLLAITGALFLRLSHLKLPFWGDEFQTINVARGIGQLAGTPSLAHAWKLQRLEMMHPPAFMVMLHFWLKLGSDTAWIRLLPSVIGLMGLFYIVKISREGGFKLISTVLIMALATSSWVFVHYSAEVGSYSLSLTTAFALIYYLLRYHNQTNLTNYVKLLLVSLFNTISYFGSWFFLPIVGGYLLFEALSRKKCSRIICFGVIIGLAVTLLYFDQLRYKWGFANSGYLVRYKLNSVPAPSMPAKFVKDNIDYFTYVFGASPWYLDATFFPSADRFGATFMRQYYLSLIFVGVVIISYYLYLSLITSASKKELIRKLLPIYFLLSTLVCVNLASFFGLYPIGAVRMSLFYAPLVIWTTLQFVDMLSRRPNLLSLVIMAFTIMLVINNLTRLYRIPQRHIGDNPMKPLYYST